MMHEKHQSVCSWEPQSGAFSLSLKSQGESRSRSWPALPLACYIPADCFYLLLSAQVEMG